MVYIVWYESSDYWFNIVINSPAAVQPTVSLCVSGRFSQGQPRDFIHGTFMAKRFSDGEIWKKKWYCDLSPALKCFWKYICDMCDNAGVWETNIPLAQYQIGAKIAEEEILTEFNGNIVKISDSKMFVVDFIKFQYGELKQDSIPHRNIFRLLEKHNIRYPIDTLSIGYREVADTLKDKDKEKDKDKDKDKEKEKEKEVGSAAILNRNVTNLDKNVKDAESVGIPDHLKDVWPAFIEVRKAKKAVNSDRAIKMLLTELGKLSIDPAVQVKIIEQSIRSSWKDVYQLKENSTAFPPRNIRKFGRQDISMAEIREKMERLKLS
jgi:hypothetical protein